MTFFSVVSTCSLLLGCSEPSRCSLGGFGLSLSRDAQGTAPIQIMLSADQNTWNISCLFEGANASACDVVDAALVEQGLGVIGALIDQDGDVRIVIQHQMPEGGVCQRGPNQVTIEVRKQDVLLYSRTISPVVYEEFCTDLCGNYERHHLEITLKD